MGFFKENFTNLIVLLLGCMALVSAKVWLYIEDIDSNCIDPKCQVLINAKLLSCAASLVIGGAIGVLIRNWRLMNLSLQLRYQSDESDY